MATRHHVLHRAEATRYVCTLRYRRPSGVVGGSEHGADRARAHASWWWTGTGQGW